jgi:hypothetical protein
MTALGVFRDDFYNAAAALTEAQFTTTAQGNGTVLTAQAIAGARECFVLSSGATALTTDSAINIIAQVQTAVNTAYKQGLGSFAAGVNPPPGAPNLFNVTWVLTIVNTNAGTLTLTGGTGVTVTGTVTTAAERVYLVTITSPTTVTIQGMFTSSTTAGTFAA